MASLDFGDRPAWSRRLAWAGIVAGGFGLLVVVVFLQIAAIDDAPQISGGDPNAVAKLRAYQDRQQFFNAMKQTGDSLLMTGVVFTLGSLALGRLAPAPEPRILGSTPLAMTPPGATPPPGSEADPSPREAVRKNRKG